MSLSIPLGNKQLKRLKDISLKLPENTIELIEKEIEVHKSETESVKDF